MSTEPSTSVPRGTPDSVEVVPGTDEDRLRAAEERLDRSTSLLRATLDSIRDGILVVDGEGRIVSYNRRFAEIWAVAQDVLERADDRRLREHVLDQLEDPERFQEEVDALYGDADRSAHDVLRLRGGRVVERYSRPQRLGDEVIGRVWTFRDVTEQERMQEALVASERRYRRLFEESRHALYITTRDGDFVDVNRAMQELLGYSRRELLGMNASDFYVEPTAREAFQREIEQRGSSWNYEMQLRDREGRLLDCLVTANTRRDPDGRIIGYEGIIEDVTARKRSTEALRASELHFRSLIENALDTISILGPDGTVTYASPSVERVLGYSPDELAGTKVFERIHAEDVDRVRGELAQVVEKPGMTASLELRFRHKEGSWRTLEAVGKNLLDDPIVGGVVVNARDVTDRKAAEEQLLHDAFHDRLTGLPNRALFMDRLGQAMKRGRRLTPPGYAVLFLDVDRFKVVNDSLGHTVGDQLLRGIGRRLEAALRPGDTVARVGGDEFALLLDGAGTAVEAEAVGERIHAAMRQPFTLAGRDVYAGVSIGIAVGTAAYETAGEILRDADIAMYRSKKAGRARSERFDPAMRDAAVAMLELQTSLRMAVEREEFVLHFQPIVSLRDGRLLGLESLVRWQHPERGLLMPEAFLEMAEDTGLIVPLGWWTLREAARLANKWWNPARGGPYVAVNLSATQFSQPDLIDRLRTVLDETGAPPQSLRLELTENVLMKQAEATVRTMTRLKDLGVPLMIDDFGIGYSSLSYLHRFAAQTLKIDGSFINGIGPHGENSEIVRTIVALADELEMEVVAEGVESHDQFRMVRILGCRSAQGFHLARPMEGELAEETLYRTWELA